MGCLTRRKKSNESSERITLINRKWKGRNALEMCLSGPGAKSPHSPINYLGG